MARPKRIDELISRICDGSEEIVDVEYIGAFLVRGPYTLRIASDGLRQQWAESIVPIEYLPLYGLKCDHPETAGGLFDAAPFAAFDRTDLQNEWLNLPPEPEPLFELCTDNFGAQFWIGESQTVYGHNLNNEFQPIGAVGDFVDFAIDMAINEQSWHRCLRLEADAAPYRLSSIEMMG
ncbi:MAG: hypothetical protein R3C18_20890 [Planctomycetaceae bacterium]